MGSTRSGTGVTKYEAEKVRGRFRNIDLDLNVEDDKRRKRKTARPAATTKQAKPQKRRSTERES